MILNSRLIDNFLLQIIERNLPRAIIGIVLPAKIELFFPDNPWGRS